MSRVDAPFTEEQVKSLNGYQQFGQMHPFTCGNDSCHHVSLVATKDGWDCPQCHKHKQTWCHNFMADGSWKEWPTLEDVLNMDKLE
jgi:hypothetical protein